MGNCFIHDKMFDCVELAMKKINREEWSVLWNKYDKLG